MKKFRVPGKDLFRLNLLQSSGDYAYLIEAYDFRSGPPVVLQAFARAVSDWCSRAPEKYLRSI
jgi:hypothetical protein